MCSAYKDVFRGSSSAWRKLINCLTCVFEEREGEGVVSQRPQEVRDVASLPEELVRRWHVGRVKGCGKKTKTIDSNLRKKPDSSGTSTGVNILWVRVCCRLLVTFSNNFAVGHITGTAACVQTTCMLIRAETEPSGILLGWRHWAAQPSVKPDGQWHARGRDVLGTTTTSLWIVGSTFSLHARPHVRSRGAR